MPTEPTSALNPAEATLLLDLCARRIARLEHRNSGGISPLMKEYARKEIDAIEALFFKLTGHRFRGAEESLEKGSADQGT